MIANIRRGGYVPFDSKELPDIILIATGSEVALAMDAKQLTATGVQVRVVSMPSTMCFLRKTPLIKPKYYH